MAQQRLVRWQLLTLALLFAGYTGCYLCRSNFSVMLRPIAASLVAKGAAPDDAITGLGTVASLGVLAYALGKFVTGSLADFWGGRRNILFGMLASVLFTWMFALGGSIPLFSLAWIGNRFVQSFCWVGAVKVTGKWFSYSSYGAAMGVVSLSYLFGDAAARWFMGRLLEAGFEWRGVFWIAGGGLFCLFLANAIALKESPVDIGEPEPPANPANVFGEQGERPAPQGLRQLLLPLLASPEFLVVCCLSLGLTLLRETFNTWSAAYLSEAVGSSSSDAATQSALFPLLGGASVLVAGWLGDRLGHRGRALIILVGCLSTVVVLLALGGLDFSVAPRAPIWLVGLAGLLMVGPYSYLAGAISLDLGGKQGSATACGFIDGVGYLGAMLAGSGVAHLSITYGWAGAFRALAGVGLLTSVAAAVFVLIQRKSSP
jgi:sugar phosphate permease